MGRQSDWSDDASAAFPRQQVQELAPRLRPVGDERRVRLLPVLGALARDPVAAEVCLQNAFRHRIDGKRVQPEDLRAQRGRQLRIAVPFAQLGRDLERAEGLDLVLR
jgi:hypothetical protein